MIHLVGDLQGCCSAFDRLLAEIGFSPSRDRLVLLGDLVNRGPDSLGVLRRLRALGDAATCLLGNHDLHLLAVAQGVRRAHRSDTVGEILAAPDCEAWLDWRPAPGPVESAGCVHAAWCRSGTPSARWRWRRSRALLAAPTCQPSCVTCSATSRTAGQTA
jgi:bis(5'-nucleosyl)-tetraphosphatase (symmetrical)